MTIQKVALIGLGAMGSYFAGRLHDHLGAENFRVIADGARRERLETEGVTINGTRYRFNIVSPHETGDPADLLIIAVKDTALSEAIDAIHNQVGPHTQILSVLNGVESEEKVAAVYGWDRVLYSFMRVSIEMKEHEAQFDPKMGKIYFGEAKNEQWSDRVRAIAQLFDASGIQYQVELDMIRGLWLKFMSNVGENLICALLGVSYSAFHQSYYANRLRIEAMWEVVRIANRLGIGLTQADITRQNALIQYFAPQNKPSTLQDLDKGKKTEVELFAGKVMALGEAVGVETPVCWMCYHGIKVLEEKNAGKYICDEVIPHQES